MNAKTRKKTLYLFWVTTEDHDEDWFTIAADAKKAARFHEQTRGYDKGDATAELICEIPSSLADHQTGSVSDDLLRECGGRLLPNPGGPRLVEIIGRVFMEGDILRNAAARQGGRETCN